MESKSTEASSQGALLHNPTLSNPNIIPRSILDQVHHFVRLPNDVMRRLSVVRVSRDPHRSPHIQIQSFLFTEHASPQAVTQTFRHDQSGIFPSLRQQNNKLIAPITKSIVNQPQLCLN